MDNPIDLAVFTSDELGGRDQAGYLRRQLRHFKAAAAKAARIYADPQNFYYASTGEPVWKKTAIVLDETMHVVAEDEGYNSAILGTPAYPVVMYVLAAGRNAKDSVREAARQEMTPTRIENELGLKPGVVRKYIHDNREKLEDLRVVRYADERTLLMKRGAALNIWGRSGERRAKDMLIFDIMQSENHDAIWRQVEALQYGDEKSYSDNQIIYASTPVRSAGDYSVKIERVSSWGQVSYRVATWRSGHNVRDEDLEIRRSNGQVSLHYTGFNIGVKVLALNAFGVVVE